MFDPCCPLEVTGESRLSILGDGSSISLSMWHSITSKGEVVSFGSKKKSILHGLFYSLHLRALLHTFVYTRRWQKNKLRRHRVPTPIVFSMKRHPSKLMGCNHHHKYTVTHPTARSWVFNSQSMGCKERQARGTQFPISLTTPKYELEENQKNSFRI